MLTKTIEHYLNEIKDEINEEQREFLSLYTQPFWKKLIRKYFRHTDHEIESMENADDSGANELFIGDAKIIFKQDDDYSYTISTEEREYELPKPITLSNFISDCLRCGIPLEWK